MDVDPDKLTAMLESLWWLAFLAAFGLCLGSFLNAVIYRVPRNLSLRNPRWSFCPGCDARIHWYDNLPIVSFLRLRGRCRHCHMPIALRYPVIELLGAIIVLLIVDALFIAHTRGNFGDTALGITWQLSDHWPMLVAHLALFICLLAMSAIDIEMYWVDVRFTTLATIAGFAMHALWTPFRVEWHRSSDTFGAAGIAATAALVVTLIMLHLLLSDEPPEQAASQATDEPTDTLEPSPETSDIASVEPPATPNDLTPPPGFDIPAPESSDELARLRPDTTVGMSSELLTVGTTEAPAVPTDFEGAPPLDALPTDATAIQRPPARWPGQLAAILAGLSLLAIMVGAFLQANTLPNIAPATARWWPALLVLFGLIVATGAKARESDQQIVEAIEAERYNARKMVSIELACLLPAIAAGVLVLWYAHRSAPFTDWLHNAMDASPFGDWQPLTGLGTAAVGFIIGGGIGWLVRIVATLLIGKEAFGTGDIHMMAAAGCVAGWPVVLIGFMLCCLLALLGWVLALPFKQTRAIPLGPWLSLAFLIVALFYDPIMQSPQVQNIVDLFTSTSFRFGP